MIKNKVMKMDFLRKLKIVLYAFSFFIIFLFGHIAKNTGENTRMALITLAILILNIIIYKIASNHFKGGKDDDKTN